jgi:hypothetical protein
MSHEGFPVRLHVYDVTTNKAVGILNKGLRKVGAGAYHAAVEVHGQEWSFGLLDGPGCGIFDDEPMRCEMHAYRESVDMGTTALSANEFAALIERMSPDWPGSSYSLTGRNCCTFSNALCLELGVGEIPAWVHRAARAGDKIVTGSTKAYGHAKAGVSRGIGMAKGFLKK